MPAPPFLRSALLSVSGTGFDDAFGPGRGTSPARPADPGRNRIPADIEIIRSREQLEYLRERLGVDAAWSDAEERGVTVRVVGGRLGNDDDPGQVTGVAPHLLPDREFVLIIEHDGTPVAAVSLADMLAWASEPVDEAPVLPPNAPHPPVPTPRPPRTPTPVNPWQTRPASAPQRPARPGARPPAMPDPGAPWVKPRRDHYWGQRPDSNPSRPRWDTSGWESDGDDLFCSLRRRSDDRSV